MAEDIIVGGVGEIVKRLISLGLDEIGLLLGVKKEVQNLQGVLNNIQAVLQDAEKKQVEQETVRVWLKDLKQVAYDAEDVLDEITYEELRRSLSHNEGSKLLSYSKRLAVRFKIGHKIKDINKKIGAIDKRKNMFKLISVMEPSHNGSSSSNQLTDIRETSSFVDDSTIVGREVDKEKIVNLLINQDSSCSNLLPVIPIVGLPGLGKTTLAQLVYNDDVVEKHFDLRVWICVSDTFDTANLFTQVLEQVILNNTKPEASSKQVLLNNLEIQLKGNKFLLVLDDVWNEDQDKWDDFALPLKKFGAIGSKIVVTSRSHVVASILGAQDTFWIQMLSDDSCWTIFERRAFMPGGPEKTSNLEKIGKEIVKKCKGVPLAAKVLGGLMHSRKEVSEWLDLQNGEIWDIVSDEENKIMKVLKLSYDHLSPALKACFSYCAIFPKDYWISRESLIQLWMAQGLLRANSTAHGKMTLEDTGNLYFNILYSKSFFQDAEMDKFGEVARCKMHDLVHDLALSTNEFECQVVKETNTTKVELSECRHASLMSTTTIDSLNEANKLRTIFPSGGHLLVFKSTTTLFSLKLLRVLDLHCSTASNLPASISKLKHLRYLDLSWTGIQSIPNWVARLYNLQTLKLESCHSLNELPDDLLNLKNLRHLLIDQGKDWKKMPSEMSKLHFLQTLPVFLVPEKDAGRGIAELETLNDLRGSLRLNGLHHVKEASSAKRANLAEKRNLRELILSWSRTTASIDDVNHIVLEELRPHSNLKFLSIKNYGGSQFSQWVSSGSVLPNLVSLQISDCHGCEHLPSFCELPCLEGLQLFDMGGVKRICGSLQSSLSSSYRSLKTLLVWGMENLEEWVEDAATFPCLKKMLIRHCPNLRRAPHLFPSLKSLELNEVGGSGVISITDSLTSLTSLTIENCDDLTFLPERLLRQNSQLSVAHIRCCTKLQSFVPDQQGLEGVLLESSLRKLVINYCDALMSIPDVRGFTSLQNLRIENCLELETIPNGFLRFLVALKKLRIISCPKLNNLGGGGGEMAFPSLQLMNVSNVYSISLFGKRNTLNSLTWLNISKVQELKTIPMELLQSFKHLQHLQIDDCPSFEGFGLSTIKEMPNINPCFHSLYISDCPAMASVDLRGFASLTKIAIIRCQGLKTLHGLQFLTVLKKLIIGAFSDDLHCFPLPNLISSLDELHILGWHALQSLPHQLQLLTTLKILYIGLFDGLTVLPEWLGNLTSLETLYIAECENLTHLPSKEQMQRLTSLRKLHISNCPRLKERCDRSGRGGPEWPKISHIQFLRID